MRLRITYAKTGSLRYTGHLDLHRVWERTVRRAGLPLAYTQGFHPGPRLSIASALPLGFVGRAEIMDIWLKEEDDPSGHPYKDLLQSAAPPGLILLSVVKVDDHLPALQTQIESAEYQVTLLEAGLGSGLEQRIADLLAAASLPRERRGKPYDLRPLILALACQGLSLQMTLSAREGATGRPEEVLDVLGILAEDTHIERVRLILKNDIE